MFGTDLSGVATQTWPICGRTVGYWSRLLVPYDLVHDDLGCRNQIAWFRTLGVERRGWGQESLNVC